MREQQHERPRSAPPGRMSLMMRAAETPSSRVLRVALVRAGRIIDEQVLREPRDITVGPTERCTFVVSPKTLSKRHHLFQVVAGRYRLSFKNRMSGSLELGDGVVDLDALKQQLVPSSKDGSYAVELGTDARGKLRLGDVTFLFQFIELPSERPRAQLPPSLTRGVGLVDWQTTVIAALSFLVHFLAVAALYSDWLDPVVDYDISVQNLVETVKSLPPPPPVEEQQVADAQEEKQAKKDPLPKAKPAAQAAREAGEKKPLSATEVAALSSELDQIEMSTIPALLGEGPATADVLLTGELSTAALDSAAASSAGVAAAGGIKLSSGGGALRPGETGGGLASIGSTGKTAAEGSGQASVMKGPTGSATIEGEQLSGGSISDARAVIARMRPGFRACYQRGLVANPDAQGRITLSLKVGPGGEVQAANASSTGNIPAEVLSCVKQRALAARFSPPEGGTAVVQVPVTFVKQ